MATLIHPDLTDTEKMLGSILQVVLLSEDRVKFFVPANTGTKYMSRLRVMITRKREKLRRQGKKPKQFTLCNTIHKETHAGIRKDCVVVWRKVSESDWLAEQLEDLL